jgi:hypothetical protein
MVWAKVRVVDSSDENRCRATRSIASPGGVKLSWTTAPNGDQSNEKIIEEILLTTLDCSAGSVSGVRGGFYV